MEIKKDKRLIVAQKSFGIDVTVNGKDKKVFWEEMEVGPVHARVRINGKVPTGGPDPFYQHPKLKNGEYGFYFPFGQHGASSSGKKQRNKYFITGEDNLNIENSKPKPDMLRIYFEYFDVDNDGEGGGNHDHSTLYAEYIVANVANVEKEGEIAIYYATSKNTDKAIMRFRKEFGGDRDRDAYYLRSVYESPFGPFSPTKSFLRKVEKVKPLPNTPNGADTTGAIYLRTGKKLNRYSLGAVFAETRYPFGVSSQRMMLERKAIYKARGDQYNIAWYPPQIVNVFEGRNKYFLATVITPLIQKDKVKIEGRWYDKEGKYLKTEKGLIGAKRLADDVMVLGYLIGKGRITEMLSIKRNFGPMLSYSFKQEQVKNKTGFNIVDSFRQIFNLNLTEKETAIIGDKGIDGYDNSYFLYRSNLKKITYAGKPLLYSFKKE